MTRSRRVLVTGATGFIGRRVVSALAREGYELVALARRQPEPPFGMAVRLVLGDLTQVGKVAEAVRGVDAVVHLAAATRRGDREEARRVNVDGSRILVEAARGAGVSRLVAVSTVTVHRDKVGAYGETKREMERLILESGLPAVVLRPSLVYGPGSGGLFHRMAGLVERLPVVPVIGGGRHPLHPIHVDDVAQAVLRALESPAAAGRAYDLVGPDAVGTDELLRRLERTLGLRRRHLHLPVPVALAAARVLEALLPDPPISVDNVIGADQPMPFDAEPARRDLGLAPRPLAQGLPTILDPSSPLDGAAEEATPLRIAVFGLGKMGVAHVALLHTIPGVRVAAVFDVQAGAARALRGMGFRVPCFPSAELALEAARPHGVIVATPPHTHAELVRLAATHGAGVLVEKPLAPALGPARDIADTLSRAGVTASCGYTLAYLPAFERARELLDRGAIGEVRLARGTMFISQVFGPKRGWIYEPEKSGGGVLPNVASHLLFLLVWYFGAPAEVACTIERLHTPLDDAARLAIGFRGGARAEVETSWSVPGYPLSRTAMSVEGTNGALTVDNEEITLDLLSPAGTLPPGITRLRAADLPQPATFDLGGEGYFREDLDFVRALRGGEPPRTSIELALQVQAILEAAYRSADRGGAAVEVAVADEPAAAAG